MSALLAGLLAETFIHPGTDQDVGVIDNPVARESTTDYPFIAGSSMKGALRDFWHMGKYENEKILFGDSDDKIGAGSVLISDARLLLLPVRSLTGAYKWATCPLLIERFYRDLRRQSLPSTQNILPKISEKKYLGHNAGKNILFLEERNFEYQDIIQEEIVHEIQKLIYHKEVKDRLEEQLIIINNDDFAWYAKYALPVQARNQLDEKTKNSKNLWYEEYLAPDTLMYFMVADRNGNTEGTKSIQKVLTEKPYFQVGGNETIGQGWFAVQFYDGVNNHE